LGQQGTSPTQLHQGAASKGTDQIRAEIDDLLAELAAEHPQAFVHPTGSEGGSGLPEAATISHYINATIMLEHRDKKSAPN
jgi:hypothetical protein